jgi:predicted dehydrogenase
MPILICGLGSIGRRHMRNLLALDQEVVLLRSGKSTLPEIDLEGLSVESDLQVALERWEPEAVIVSNPTALHLEFAIPAAEAGCHLLIEKPVSNTMDGVSELQQAVQRNAVEVLIGFQFRFHPVLKQVKTLLEEETIGRPLYVRSHWGEYLPDWHPWEDYRASYSAREDLGGGVVLTLCHPFDYLRWLFGEVKTVSGLVMNSGALEIDVEDTAEAILTFNDGPLASVHLDYNQRPAQHRLEIVGSRGSILWDQAEAAASLWSDTTGEWKVIPPPAGFERNTLFRDEMRHFLDLIEGKTEPVCSLEDGIRALEIALAVKHTGVQGEGYVWVGKKPS